MAAVLRLKRKACDEPAEGLVIALKRPKCELSENVNEVFFKFAATVKSEKESIKNHIQAALSKEKVLSYSRWRDQKSAVRQKNVHQICQKLKAEHKAANEKKRLDLLNNRRLIFSETVPVEDNEHESLDKDIEVRKLFQLYDIIEENEDVKKQGEELESIITCNNQPLIREKTDYVYDVYIADVPIDDTFIDSAVCVRPCSLTIDDLYFGNSEDSEECYEDEDDSNDENNWRNDYPDESDSDKDDVESDYDIHEYHDEDIVYALDKFDIDEDDDEEGEQYDSSHVLRELPTDDDDDDDD